MKKYLLIILRLVLAGLLIQTLYFKFGAHPDSVYIFTKIGMEPHGRIGIGVMELIASILLLIPRTAWAGALLAVGILSGAIFMHLTILGIEVQGDDRGLFYTGILLFFLALVIAWLYKKDIPFIGIKFK